MTLCHLAALALPLSSLLPCARALSEEPPRRSVRVAVTQPRARVIDYRLTRAEDVLAAVDRNLEELAALARKAGEARCDIVAFPEDTPGLIKWVSAREKPAAEVLREVEKRLLGRLGEAAAAHRMYLVCSSDTVDAEGALRNTAFLLGRDGKEIGRYHKVNLTIHEQRRKRGDSFPVFQTPDLGGIGLLICYDMVFPEAARCLALGGADLIFHPTMGGAAIGDGDVSRAAFRTRAVENFVYVAVSHRGGGSMVISPRGAILAEGKEPDEVVIAEIDVHGGREGGDAFNQQRDMRARLFRERSPQAYGRLTDPHPPALERLPEEITVGEACRIACGALTVGEDRFEAADELLAAGKTAAAAAAFAALRAEFPGTWIDRAGKERLAGLGTLGVAAAHPGDAGIGGDPRVLFHEDFEAGAMADLKKRWSEASDKDGKVLALTAGGPAGTAGKRCLQMSATVGEDTGGHLYVQLPRAVDECFARFHVQFAADADRNGDYIHHFVHLGGYHPPTKWPQGGAGERPAGDERFTVGIEPTGDNGAASAPGVWNFYTYWHEMKVSAGGKYWGNGLRPARPAVVPRGRWQCVEVRVKLNTAPGKSDGELTLWLDGELVMDIRPGVPRGRWTGMGFQLLEAGVKPDPEKGEAPFEGFRWRTSEELRVNFFWLLHYVTDGALRRNRVEKLHAPNRVWFDDIVVATEYVGPIARK
jgi:predicted amidohydrolase